MLSLSGADLLGLGQVDAVCPVTTASAMCPDGTPATTTAPSRSAPTGSSLCDEKTVEYLRDLIGEKHVLEAAATPQTPKSIVLRLLEQGKASTGLLRLVRDCGGEYDAPPKGLVMRPKCRGTTDDGAR
jgi:hypothetical protein